ncbi:MAG: hypothetical protein MUO76_23905 [Anaerolineaceae bacterium]|nr:hypothetical protein [Anaerolineaceae bacterium]
MTYPLSSSVSAGDSTLASHYNNLRLDGLYLGQAASNAVPLGTALERYETRLEIEKLAAATVRVPASASAPVSLVIDGFLCQAVANVDLDGGESPAGAAAPYYVFANRADDSTTFTLTVSTVTTEAANQRRIGRFYWDGSAIVKDSVRSEFAGFVVDLLYFVDPQVCNGRLSLSTGVPVPETDISSSSTVYFMPYLGNRVALYVNDYGWRMYSFSELTLDISGVGDATNIDVWLYDNEGTLTLAYTAWSNDILRATALVRQDGVLVKSGAPAYRYLGSIRTSGAGVSADTKLKRFIPNYYNRVQRELFVPLSGASHTYTLATWRKWGNVDTFRVEFLVGVNEDPIHLLASGIGRIDSGGYAGVGIGLDSGVALATDVLAIGTRVGTSEAERQSSFVGLCGIGFHYLQLLQYSQAAGTTTWFNTYIGAGGLLGFIYA